MIGTLVDGFAVTIFAMGIVFAVLAVLMFIIMLQTYIFKEKKNSNVNDGVVMQTVQVPKKVQPTLVENKRCEDAEIAAAIIAAICSYTNLSSNEFIIKGIKRVSGNESSWRNAGIIQ